MKSFYSSLILLFSAAVLHGQTIVTFYTTKGNFAVEIYDNIVPVTGNNFLTLVNQKFYDGVIFHRVINNFMIQGGDPTGTGSGGPGYTIPDEFDSSLSNVQKTISMANSGPNTGGSQFFINLVDNTYLDFNKPPLTSKHPVFGKVIANFNIVQDIGLVATNASDRPLVDVVMDSIREGYGLAVGLEPLKSKSISVSIYPNPIDETSVLAINSMDANNSVIKVFDMTGKLIESQNVNLYSGNNKIPIKNLISETLSPGLYHIQVFGKNVSERINFILR